MTGLMQLFVPFLTFSSVASRWPARHPYAFGPGYVPQFIPSKTAVALLKVRDRVGAEDDREQRTRHRVMVLPVARRADCERGVLRVLVIVQVSLAPPVSVVSQAELYVVA